VRKLVALVLIGSIVAVPACTKGGTKPTPIVLGEVDPITGPLAAPGFHNGIVLAVRQANQAGGVHGTKIELIAQDNQSRPDLASSAAQNLIARRHAVALVGGFVDSLVAPVAALANARHVPFVATASLAKELTSVGNRYFFRVSSLHGFTDATTGFLQSRGVGTAAIFYSDTPGSTELAQDQRDAMQAAGIQVGPFESLTIGTQDFSALLAKLRSASPDALVVNDPSEGDVILMAKQMKALAVRPSIVVFSFGLEPATIAAMGADANGLYATVAWEPGLPLGGETARTFTGAYRDAFGKEPDEGAAHGYAAATALIQALRMLPAGQITPDRIVDALHRVSVDTVLGTVRFQPNGDPASYLRYVVRVQDGTYALVYRPTPA
jgi:branched-chain amino acid transport system substrate-binding protein